MLTRREFVAGAAGLGILMRQQPSFLMPVGATDCHAHVFCEPKAFPMMEGRSYTPDPAPVDELQALHKKLNIERVVIIQPSIYGTDNTCTLAAIRQIGSRARGIAVIDDKTPDAELDRLERSGIRGIRVNLQTTGQTDPAVGKQRFESAVKRIGTRRWHVQMFVALPVIEAMKDVLEASPVPLVFDHFGGAQASLGTSQPGFETLVSLVKSGKAYVKLSAPYRASTAPGYADVTSLAKALIEANPRRILWGSDWPHPDSNPSSRRADTGTNPRYAIDDTAVLSQLASWAPTIPLRRIILVENPAALYGW